MKRRKLITVAALAVLALACSETAGSMLEDAGTMLADAGDMLADAGDMMQPDAGAQDTPASCNKSQVIEGGSTFRWAEFPISSPGQTEVTMCWGTDANQSISLWARARCARNIASWFEGTSTGHVYCGQLLPDGEPNGQQVTSITVHN